jgi:hypothetical protein
LAIVTHFIRYQKDTAEVVDHVRGNVFEGFSSRNAKLAVETLQFVAGSLEAPAFSELGTALSDFFVGVMAIWNGPLVQLLKVLQQSPMMLGVFPIELVLPYVVDETLASATLIQLRNFLLDLICQHDEETFPEDFVYGTLQQLIHQSSILLTKEMDHCTQRVEYRPL